MSDFCIYIKSGIFLDVHNSAYVFLAYPNTKMKNVLLNKPLSNFNQEKHGRILLWCLR